MAQQGNGENGHGKAPTIVVVGAGIIGLTSALKIQAALQDDSATRRTEVLLVAREWPTAITGSPGKHSVDYASMWAGAHVRPVPASTPYLRREAEWVKASVAEFAQHLEVEPWAGITQLLGVELLEAPGPEYRNQDAATFEEETGLMGYRRLEEQELPQGVRLGYEYETYCINAPLYCSNLLRKFVLQGGKTLKRDLKSEWEAFSLAPNVELVINASGMGFKDPKCYPIRGQTVVTNLSSAKKTVTKQMKDGSWSFIIPRSFNGGTIIGGTKEPHDWRVEPAIETRNHLLKAAQGIIPIASGEELKVLGDVVGRRPARYGGMRVEIEAKETLQGSKHNVIHAYGAAGRGYEISWGVAGEVASLAQKLPPFSNATKAKL